VAVRLIVFLLWSVVMSLSSFETAELEAELNFRHELSLLAEQMPALLKSFALSEASVEYKRDRILELSQEIDRILDGLS